MNMKMKSRRRARIREERQSLLVKPDEKSGWFMEQTSIHETKLLVTIHLDVQQCIPNTFHNYEIIVKNKIDEDKNVDYQMNIQCCNIKTNRNQ